MAARIIYDTENEVPENIRNRAAQNEHGKFEIDAEPLLENHAQLQRELQRSRDALARFAAENPNAEHERIVAEIRRERDALVNRLADREIDSLITEAGGNPKLLRPHVRGSIKPEFRNGELRLIVIDGTGQPRNDATGLPVSARDAIQVLKSDPDMALAFANETAPRVGQDASAGPELFRTTRKQVRLSREQAKDPGIYREAVRLAGSVDGVIISRD